MPAEEPMADDIEYCAQDLLDAVKAGDVKGIAEALKSAWSILDSQPDESQAEPHSYDAQNELAAKGQE